MPIKKHGFCYILITLLVLNLAGCDLSSSSDSPAVETETTNIRAEQAPLFNYNLAQFSKLPNSRSLLYSKDPTIAYCEFNLSQSTINGHNQSGPVAQNYSGTDATSLYPAASLSKIFLTAFALHKLGPDYSFTHEWRFVRYKDGAIEAYLNTNYDPVVHIPKILYSLAEIKKLGVTNIRKLYISSKTRVYLSVLDNPHKELSQVPLSSDDSIQNLKLILNSKNWGPQTKQARETLMMWAQSQNKTLTIPEQFQVESVVLDTNNVAQTLFAQAKVLKFQSSSLFKYLKEINVESNNYISDALFSALGGAQEFFKFQENILKLSKNEMRVYTGSGLPTQNNELRQDNLVSCQAVLRTLQVVEQISQQAQFNLGLVFLVAGTDVGTYPTTNNFGSSTVIKTGRLYDVPALNLAGIVSTSKGLMAFTFLGHQFNNDDEELMKQKRDLILQNLISTFGATPQFRTVSQKEILFK